MDEWSSAPAHREGPEILSRWVASLEALDLEALVDLYDDEAVVATPNEEVRGREQLRGTLETYLRRVRGLRVVSVSPRGRGDDLSFETLVQSRLGQARIRHEWRLGGGRILGHSLQVLEHRKPLWLGGGTVTASPAPALA